MLFSFQPAHLFELYTIFHFYGLTLFHITSKYSLVFFTHKTLKKIVMELPLLLLLLLHLKKQNKMLGFWLPLRRKACGAQLLFLLGIFNISGRTGGRWIFLGAQTRAPWVKCSNSALPCNLSVGLIWFGKGTTPETSEPSKRRVPNISSLQILRLRSLHSQGCTLCQRNILIMIFLGIALKILERKCFKMLFGVLCRFLM